jgi:anthranilate phosphoribosyltransferase
MPLTPYIKKVGTGPRGSKDLTIEEAREAVRILLSEEADPVQFGAFCMALRVKGESDEELIGGLLGLLDQVPQVAWPAGPMVTLGPSLDGKDRVMPGAPAAALLAAAMGVRVLVLSERDLPPKRAVTPSLVFEELGFQIPNTFSEAAGQLDQQGWACLELGRAIPGLERLKLWRAKLGKRPFLSTIEKLLNPARSPLLTGVFHAPILRQMDAVLRGAQYPRSMVIQGSQGSTDPKISVTTRALLIEPNREAEPLVLDPQAVGLELPEEPILDPATAKNAADWTRSVLLGENQEGRNAVAMAVAVILLLANPGIEFPEAVSRTLERWEEARGRVLDLLPPLA